MNTRLLQAELRRDEGEVLHAYQDNEGYWTIGVGVLIDARRGGGITRQESMVLLGNRIVRCQGQLRAHLPYWDALADARQRALANMAFQMGIDGVLAFEHMLAAIRAKDWSAARAECLDSRYAKQTPARAARVAEMLATGRAATGRAGPAAAASSQN